MATKKIDEILEAIANMSVLEVSDLIKAMEENLTLLLLPPSQLPPLVAPLLKR